jgi:protein BUR2
MLDGLTVAEERLRRIKGVNFIIQAGILLRLPHTTIWVAGVFFHRFFMRVSMVEKPESGVHHYVRPAPGIRPARRNDGC